MSRFDTCVSWFLIILVICLYKLTVVVVHSFWWNDIYVFFYLVSVLLARKFRLNVLISCYYVFNRYSSCNFPPFSVILTLELLLLTSLQVMPPDIIVYFLTKKILICVSLCFFLLKIIYFFCHLFYIISGVQAYLAGLTFALAASPCSTPVLATLLGYVATSRVCIIGYISCLSSQKFITVV